VPLYAKADQEKLPFFISRREHFERLARCLPTFQLPKIIF